MRALALAGLLAFAATARAQSPDGSTPPVETPPAPPDRPGLPPGWNDPYEHELPPREGTPQPLLPAPTPIEIRVEPPPCPCVPCVPCCAPCVPCCAPPPIWLAQPPPFVARKRPPPPNTSRFWLEISAGAVGHYIYDETFAAGQLALTLGRQNDHVAGGLTLIAQAGRTQLGGLTFGGFLLAPGMQVHVGRFRLAFGIELGPMAIATATRADDFSAFLLGIWIQPSVDLWRSGNGWWFLAARGSLDGWLSSPLGNGDNPGAIQFSASFGFRL